MTQKSCFLVVAQPEFGSGSLLWTGTTLEPHSGFGPGSLLWTGTTLEPQKQLLTVHSVFSKPRYFHSYAFVCCKSWGRQGFGPGSLLWTGLWSHRNSFSMNIVCFPSPGIFMAMRYNIGIKMHRCALVQIYSQDEDVGVCCKSWGRQGQSFATNTHGKAINLHQCSVVDLNGYYSEFEW